MNIENIVYSYEVEEYLEAKYKKLDIREYIAEIILCQLEMDPLLEKEELDNRDVNKLIGLKMIIKYSYKVAWQKLEERNKNRYDNVIYNAELSDFEIGDRDLEEHKLR